MQSPLRPVDQTVAAPRHSVERKFGRQTTQALVVLLVSAVVGAGCGGPLQEIKVNSNPNGAAVSVDGKSMGVVTPAVLQLKAGDDRVVSLSNPGYETQTVRLKSKIDGAKIAGHFGYGFGLGFGLVLGAGLASANSSSSSGEKGPDIGSVLLASLLVGAIGGGIGLLLGTPFGIATKSDFKLTPAAIDVALVPSSQQMSENAGLRLEKPLGASQAALGEASLHETQAKQLFAAERWQEAADEFGKAHLAGGDPAPLFNQAICYRRLGDKARAIALYKEFLAKTPADHPERATAQERVATLEGEMQEQTTTLPDGKLHETRAKQLFAAERWQEAADEFGKAHLAGGDPAPLFNQAICYRRLGDKARAIALYKEFLAKAPPDHPERATARERIATLEGEMQEQTTTAPGGK